MRRFAVLLFSVAAAAWAPAGAAVRHPLISGISAFHAGGQTFLQWEEGEAEGWATFNVYRSDGPISSVAGRPVECLARDIIPRSGRNFYQLRRQGYVRESPDMEARRKVWAWASRNVKPAPVGGFPLPGGRTSSPTGGLFVRTVPRSGKSWYAVTVTPWGKPEETLVVAGGNALSAPVEETAGTPQPYQVAGIAEEFPPEKRPAFLELYAIAGIADEEFAKSLGRTKTYLFWMPKEFGWREGLPTMVTVRHKLPDDYYELWPDDGNFAFAGFPNAWWYGYNTEIVHPDRLAQGVVKDFSHRKLLFLIDWFFRTVPQADRERFGVRGSSMGGTGALCFGIRHPELFATIDVGVPAGDPARLPGGKDSFETVFGPVGAPIKAESGRTVWEEFSNTRYISETVRDLPFIRLVNGRFDHWMEWAYTVPLYRALIANRHAFTAFWYPGGHGGGSQFAITLFREYPLDRIGLRKSMLAIGDCSSDETFGAGDPADGDKYGGLNVYVRWEIEKDAADGYAAVLRPLKGDAPFLTVTPRRVQGFVLRPGETVAYRLAALFNNATIAEGTAAADGDGILTLRKLGPVHSHGARLTLKRTP